MKDELWARCEELEALVVRARELCGCIFCHPAPYAPPPAKPIPTNCLAEEILRQLVAFTTAERIRRDLEQQFGRPVQFIGEDA